MAAIVGHEQVGDNVWIAQKRQVMNPSVDDVTKFFKALDTVKLSPDWDVNTSRKALAGITIGTGVGNSIQDLQLSLYGFKFGKFIRNGEMTRLSDAAKWIRTNLGGDLSDQVQPQGDTAIG